MTENELVQRQQEYGDKRFVVTKSGKFFSAYGCGAFALARATGYRVMRRQRKGGHFVLTTGFPENRIENVLEQLEACGGKIEQRGEEHFVFSGIDGSEDEKLVSDQKPAVPRHGKENKKQVSNDSLQALILSFDLSRSTPMEAMNFIYQLQKRIQETDV